MILQFKFMESVGAVVKICLFFSKQNAETEMKVEFLLLTWSVNRYSDST